MKRNLRSLAALAVAGLATLGAGPVAAAAASDAAPPDDNYGYIEAPALEGVESARASEPSSDSPIPEAYHDALWRLGYDGALDDVNAIEWDDEAQQLVFYRHGDSSDLARAVGAELPADGFAIAPAVHAKAEVDAVLDGILATGGFLADGIRVVTAEPAIDGSSIAIGIEGDVAAGAALFTAQQRSSVPLTFEVAREVQQATRNVTSALFRFGGALMTTPTGPSSQKWCSTGFTIGSFNISGAIGLMSADHCGRDVTSMWNYSSSSTSSDNMSTYQGMLTITGSTSVDLGLWYSSTGTAAFYPYIYTGDYQDVGTISAVRGSVQPVVNDKVCYSGARSGRVCDNTVTLTGALVCYSISLCYAGETYTSQDSSIEAAGNGDSGGPVYASVNGQVRAAGIISGIFGGSTTCTGDPGGPFRSCSPVAIYEPIVYGLGPSTTGWGLLVVP